MMKKTTFLLAIMIINFTITAQIVTIPDANFKAALVGDLAINSNSDTEIQVAEAIAYTGIMDVNGLNISDLTGIEAFINLTQLKCYNNNLATIDITNNTALTVLAVGQNQLTSIDISNNTNLTGLSLEFNQLTTLDISNNISLADIIILNNPITTFNISVNVNLTDLNVSGTPFPVLDLSNNNLLINLFCDSTMLTDLNLINNNNLQFVWASSNPNLSTLNIKNGNNTAIFSFKATNNPNLTCIEVDDTTWANANWTMIDAIASFSTNCSVGVNEIEQNNLAVAIYPNPAQELFTVKINNKKSTELFMATLTDYTGKIVLQTQLLNNEVMDVSNLPNGVYQLKLENNSFMAVKKVVVAK